MNPAKIKICGITSAGDARLAASLGADYLGLIFARGPRKIDVGRAREIRDAEPDAVLVGVFADTPVEHAAASTAAAGVDLVQLHGNESPGYCAQLRAATGKPIIKAFAGDKIPGADVLENYGSCGYFLFDLDKSTNGGRQRNADLKQKWSAVARRKRQGFDLFLAGALDQTNVREAVDRTGAFGVDVCSGVEKSPGVKDPDALARFIEEVRS